LNKSQSSIESRPFYTSKRLFEKVFLTVVFRRNSTIARLAENERIFHKYRQKMLVFWYNKIRRAKLQKSIPYHQHIFIQPAPRAENFRRDRRKNLPPQAASILELSDILLDIQAAK